MPLKPRHVQETGGVPVRRPCRKGGLWYRLPATVADLARGIGTALAALQYLRDIGMRLPLLHLLERGDMRVAIVEPGHEAERDLPVRLMIEEAAAIGILVQRPTLGVDHPALRVFLGVDVPQFLDAQAIDLRFAIGVERELRLPHLGQMPAHALGKKGVFRVKFKPRRIVRLVAAVARPPHRSEERRVGEECGSTVRSRWSPSPKKKK